MRTSGGNPKGGLGMDQTYRQFAPYFTLELLLNMYVERRLAFRGRALVREMSSLLLLSVLRLNCKLIP